MKVLNDNVLILEEASGPRTSAAGLYLPETSEEGQVIRGKVLEVGPGARNNDGARFPMTVRVDDVVWFRKFDGSRLTVDGKRCYVIPENTIVAIE